MAASPPRLKPLYTQYKLDRVTFVAIPRQIGGTDPSPAWIYLDVGGMYDQFNYSAIQELQGSRRLPVKNKSFTRYSNTGRQDDFHYWYDITARGDVYIKLHCESIPTDQKFWQFQLEYTVHFRGFVVPVEGNRGIERTIRAIKNGEGEAEREEVGEKPYPDELNRTF